MWTSWILIVWIVLISMAMLVSSNKALRVTTRKALKKEPTTVAELNAELLQKEFKDDEEYETYMQELAKRTENLNEERRLNRADRKLQDIENCDIYSAWMWIDRSALSTYDFKKHDCPYDEQLILFTAWLHSWNSRTCYGDRYMGSELMDQTSNTGHYEVAEAVRHYYTLHWNSGSCTYDPWLYSEIMCCEL